MGADGVATLVYVFGIVSMLLGGFAGSAELLAGATVLVGIGYALRDYAHPAQNRVSAMTFYMCFAGLWFGLGNLAGYLAEGGPLAARFYVYEASEHIFAAQLIASAGTLIPGLAHDWATSQARAGLKLPVLPAIGFPLRPAAADRAILGLLGLDWVSRLGGLSTGGLGTVSTVVALGSDIAIFILTSRWLGQPAPRSSLGLAFPACLAVATATHSFLFDPLRMNLLLPVGALCLPFVLRKAVGFRFALAGIGFLSLFVLVFEPFREFRWQAQGTERFTAVAGQLRAEDEDRVSGSVAVLARLSTFNQLSQVVRITEQEGFYRGSTLAYVFYVFIPRVIWPDKPVIAPGRWFAEKLGRGRELEYGFSNAINMTIPGELYLNFGWPGVVLGMAGMGLLYHLLWQAARAVAWPANVVGMTFGLIILNQAMFGGSHFGAVVNLVIWYLAALFATWAWRTLALRRAPAAPPPPRAFHARAQPLPPYPRPPQKRA
jgi:hypothetical protein